MQHYRHACYRYFFSAHTAVIDMPNNKFYFFMKVEIENKNSIQIFYQSIFADY